MSIQYPIMNDTYNYICELVTCSQLSKSSLQVLQDMCNFYQLGISSINITRKKLCVDLLTTLVDSCSSNTPLKVQRE